MTPQEIQFARLRLVSYNEFDGKSVAEYLRKQRRLYDNFVVGRFGHGTLIELRDMGDGTMNVDTIYLVAPLANREALRAGLVALGADEFGWFDEEGRGYEDVEQSVWRECGMGRLPPGRVLIRVWWD